MRKLVLICSGFAVVLVAGCSSASNKVDSNFECAALISAVSHLSAQGALETDSDFDSQSLFSLMSHLNSYAIPNRLSEAEAFAQLNALRAELIEAKSPSNIFRKAKTCVRNTPKT